MNAFIVYINEYMNVGINTYICAICINIRIHIHIYIYVHIHISPLDRGVQAVAKIKQLSNRKTIFLQICINMYISIHIYVSIYIYVHKQMYINMEV
jgi:hypothetical protein